MSKHKTRSFGISKKPQQGQRKSREKETPQRVTQLPAVLPYPEFFEYTEDNIRDILCYIVKHYGREGLSVLYYRDVDRDECNMVFGDWSGNIIDLQTGDGPMVDIALGFAKEKSLEFLKLMSLIKINQAQFYFAIDNNSLVLVDMQIAMNKFAGPGMIKDIFGNICATQEVKKVEVIDDRAIEYINKGTGSYEGDIILKPSRFRIQYGKEETSILRPFYVEIKR